MPEHRHTDALLSQLHITIRIRRATNSQISNTDAWPSSEAVGARLPATTRRPRNSHYSNAYQTASELEHAARLAHTLATHTHISTKHVQYGMSSPATNTRARSVIIQHSTPCLCREVTIDHHTHTHTGTIKSPSHHDNSSYTSRTTHPYHTFSLSRPESSNPLTPMLLNNT